MKNLNATAKRTGKRVAFLIGEDGPSCALVLGGKGAGLVELARESVPVPPYFTITTAVHRAYAQNGKLPLRFDGQVRRQMAALEKLTGRRFGDSHRPLLVSVRSGAPVSMPGMMDTILNLGMTTRVVVRMAKSDGGLFAYQCYKRFLRTFGVLVLGMKEETFEQAVVFTQDGAIGDPPRAWELEDLCRAYRYVIGQELKEQGLTAAVLEDPWQQLTMAVVAVLRSWNNDRAVLFREHHKIAHSLGTAVNVQMMVFGNRDEKSGTGVAFSCDVNTGKPGATGEFLPVAQGEDLVAGTATPLPLQFLREWNPVVYDELVDVLQCMAARRGKPVEIEYTVESGKLYVLQVRAAKLSVPAVMALAVHDVWAKKATKAEALSRVSRDNIEAVRTNNFDPIELEEAKRFAVRGIAAAPGAAVGKVVRTSEAACRAHARGERVILVTDDTKPEDLAGMMAAVAIVTRNGGYTCHAAVVARDLGKPAVVGCEWRLSHIEDGDVISVDGHGGLVISKPLKLSVASHTKEVNLFLKWVRGLRPQGRLALHTYKESYCLHGIISDFYLVDVMAKVAKGTRLQEEAADLKDRVQIAIAERVAMYLTSAVAGELRHASLSFPKVTAETKQLNDEFGVVYFDDGRSNAQDRALVKLAEMPHEKHVEFLRLATKVFELGWEPDSKGKFSIGGYPWANIASWTCQFLTGEQSHYGFTDHAFDLVHNGGTTFGKNQMLVFDYDTLMRLLETKKHMAADPYRARRQLRSASQGKRDQEVESLYQKGLQLGVWEDPESMAQKERLDRVHPGRGFIGYDQYENNSDYETTSSGVYAKSGHDVHLGGLVNKKYQNAYWKGYGMHVGDGVHHGGTDHGGGHHYEHVTPEVEKSIAKSIFGDSPGETLGDILAQIQKKQASKNNKKTGQPTKPSHKPATGKKK